MKCKKFLIFITLFFFFISFSVADRETELLLRILVKKGILTKDEAKRIKGEVKKELSTPKEKVSLSETREKPSEILKRIKFSGDFRIRNQWQDTGNNDRDRERIRYRLNGLVKPFKDFEIGFGFASGGSDPRSTNVTLGDTFDTKDIRLDHVYAEYFFKDGVSIWAGKYKDIYKSLWEVCDLLWDDDLRPEGAGMRLRFGGDNFKSFFNFGMFILDELKSKADPRMFYFEPGISFDFSKKVSLSGAISYYYTENVKGNVLNYSSGTNTLEDGVLKYDYNSIEPILSLEFKNISNLIHYASIFGEYVYNPDPQCNNSGYLIGFKFGDKRINDFKKWQAKYMYRRLEKDAWLDVFPDSDSFGGKTGIRGHEFLFKFGIYKNFILGFDYYRMKKIEKPEDIENLFQTDLVWKF